MENQRIAISKRLLKEALMRLLETKEIGRISITELCREAGINRATFYRHYNLPQDVLAEIENDIVQKAQQIAALPAQAGTQKIYVERLCEYVYENADVIRILIRSNTEANLFHMFDSCNMAMLETIMSARNDFAFDKNNLRLISAYLSGGGYHLIRAWLMDDVPKTPKEMAQFILDLLGADPESFFVLK